MASPCPSTLARVLSFYRGHEARCRDITLCKGCGIWGRVCSDTEASPRPPEEENPPPPLGCLVNPGEPLTGLAESGTVRPPKDHRGHREQMNIQPHGTRGAHGEGSAPGNYSHSGNGGVTAKTVSPSDNPGRQNSFTEEREAGKGKTARPRSRSYSTVDGELT